MKRPTDTEYAAYDGMHCHSLWRQLPEGWRCPVCGRSKRGILIWGVRKGSNAAKYGPIGWKAAVHKHHDHGPLNGCDFGGDHGRFRAVVICGACNAADGNIKARLGLPASFSFSPAELRRIIRATDNAPPQIQWEIVTEILHQLEVGLPPPEFTTTKRRMT
jgi:hypothetical protein